ncbi:hypothetical protein CUMW_233950 [Citrus unshiu]|uniref:glucose-6-phosphate dehydrogenase (NADP(+)) n=1 Tax=Citrus unshiu TaxID=55188 RepID=A0A2H5QIP0_CITUN|nr:hypothetical protein CUMW_233950 [Citrus unshiu]
MSSISIEILSLVVNSETSLELWTSLEQQFGSETSAKKVHLKIMLNNLRKGSMTVTKFFGKLKTIADELAIAGNPISSLDFLTHLISGLGQPYYPVVVYLEANLAKISINEAYSMLLSHEARLEANQLSSSKEAKLNYAANIAQTGSGTNNNNKKPGGQFNNNWNGGQFNNNWNKNGGFRGGYTGGRGGYGRNFSQGQGRGNWNGGWNGSFGNFPQGGRGSNYNSNPGQTGGFNGGFTNGKDTIFITQTINHYKTQLFSDFIVVPRKYFFSAWVSQVQSRIHARKHFQLKSSNGHPLNAVSLQDSEILLENLWPNDHSEPQEIEASVPASSEKSGSTLSITVVGASGDLAKKKIFPALFALYYEDCLPEDFTVFGYARTKLTDEELRNVISKTLTYRIDKKYFLKRCFYHSGLYSSEEHFAELDSGLKEKEVVLLIKLQHFLDVAKCASLRAFIRKLSIVEKPFGRDSESSGELTRSLKQYLREDQIFRIDHYLGKELVENLSVLRFSNLVFEPLWSRNYIRNVHIFSEDFGTEGRGGYFDNYGIIRDIMQNHLL